MPPNRTILALVGFALLAPSASALVETCGHRAYLHPGAEFKLEVDEDALDLAVPIDRTSTARSAWFAHRGNFDST